MHFYNYFNLNSWVQLVPYIKYIQLEWVKVLKHKLPWLTDLLLYEQGDSVVNKVIGPKHCVNEAIQRSTYSCGIEFLIDWVYLSFETASITLHLLWLPKPFFTAHSSCHFI